MDYHPLDPENREIRLVRLRLPEIEPVHDGPKNADIIALDLQHVSMNDQVHYAAVSYVWGSTAASDMVEISVNDKPFYVGKNLHAALVEFRRERLDEWLWIDAICIHQSDNEEKSWHVDRMTDVFRDAELVHIWLGPGTIGSDVAMDFISRYGPRALQCHPILLDRNNPDTGITFFGLNDAVLGYLDGVKSGAEKPLELEFGKENGARIVQLADLVHDLIHEPGWARDNEDQHRLPSDHLVTGMQDIFQRAYWHRIWVIQEVTLARRGQVHCGAKTVTLDVLIAVLAALDLSFQSPFYPLFPVPKPHSLRIAFGGALSSNPLTLRLQHQFLDERRYTRISDILLRITYAPKRPFYTATDPRDLVYGLLGVISPEQRLGIRADYTMTPGQVLAQFTKIVLEPERTIIKGNELCLNFSFPRKEPIPDCPSWVPDFVEMGKSGLIPRPFWGQWDDYKACGQRLQPRGAKKDPDPEPLILRRVGCRVAVVTEVMPAPEWNKPSIWPGDWSIKDHEKWLRDIREFAGLGDETGPAEDYIWRTVARVRPETVGSENTVNKWRHEHNHLVRKIMRRKAIDPSELTEDEAEFFWKGPYSFYLENVDKLEDRIDETMHSWVRWVLPLRERTFFKTNKGMFGICHPCVKPGDVVVLIWEVGAPMVLRPREGGGFTVQGDAWVDCIMDGEFLETNPAHEEFVLY